jgi:GT2 family glycosyltransferase/glycosyltransferase involved in cell wall biosynthesis
MNAESLKACVVIPSWNGADMIRGCLDSLKKQTLMPHVIVVDQGSSDGSEKLLKTEYPWAQTLVFADNAGFDGGVNRGIKPALAEGFEYILLLNNDATADKDWVKELVASADANKKAGIVTSKIAHTDGVRLDSTGDFYTTWGYSYPRGRGEDDHGQYDTPRQQEPFGASAGATLYRAAMLKQIGTFDERFFAYYEDTDISFRAHLAGWGVRYEPKARVFHRINATSDRLPSAFRRYHTIKNFFYVYTKNMPGRLYWKYLPKFWTGYAMYLARDATRGLLTTNLKGLGVAALNLPVMLWQRWKIQRGRKAPVREIEALLEHELPPTQQKTLAFMRRIGLTPGTAMAPRGTGKRIVIDGRMLFWTGVGRYTKALLANLEAMDDKNQYAVLVRREDWNEYEPQKENFTKVEASINPYTFGEQVRLAWLLGRLRPDLVHFVAPNSPALYRGRRVMTVHDLTLLDYNTSRGTGLVRLLKSYKRLPFKLLVRWVVRRAATVITPTEFVERQLERRFGVERGRLRVVPLGFDEPAEVEPKRLAVVGADDEFLFMVGNFYPYKNVASTVEALKLLEGKFPKLKLVAAGHTDWFSEEVEAKAKELGLSSRVVLPGRVSDEEKGWLYRHARLYLYPSRSEGFGLQGLEAMSQGLPVVAAQASSLPEVYGNAAAYFDPLNVKAQAETIARVLEEDALRDRLVKAGYYRVKLYSWARMTKRTHEVYAAVLGIPKGEDSGPRHIVL